MFPICFPIFPCFPAISRFGGHCTTSVPSSAPIRWPSPATRRRWISGARTWVYYCVPNVLQYID
jgi:hypothetical protein